MSDNDNNMNMYGVNNNSSSSSSLTKEEVFIKIKDLVSQYKIEQEMENDGNDQYYAILSQSIHKEFVGDILNSKNKIPEKVIEVVDILKNGIKSLMRRMKTINTVKMCFISLNI
jgi:hypothetical protein